MTLEAPSNLVAKGWIERRKVEITFDPVNGATKYKLVRSLESHGNYQTLTDSLITTTYHDTGLDDGTLYWYKISAGNDNDIWSSPSGKTSTYTKHAIVTIDLSNFSFTSEVINTQIFVTGSPNTQVKLTFAENINASVIDIYDFEVKVIGITSQTKELYYTGITDNIITLTLLDTITDANANIKIRYKTWETGKLLQVTNKILPGAVEGLGVEFLNKRANLSWTATSGAEHYIIEQKKASGNWVQIATNIKITKFTAGGLQNGEDYQFRVFPGKPGGLKNDIGAIETLSNQPTVYKGFDSLFPDIVSGVYEKLIKNLKAETGRVKKGSIPTDIIIAQKDLITSATTDSGKRNVRNEVIHLLFSAIEDAAADISSIVLTKDDLAITTSAIKKTDLVVILPAKNEEDITLNLEDYDNDTDLQDKGFYIPIENGEAVLLNFKGDKRVLFDRQDDGTDEKIFLTQPQDTSTFTKISRTTFDIDSITENYLLPDDLVTVNGIEIVIGSIGDARAPPSSVGEEDKPDKTQSGIFKQPDSVLNNYYSSGGFGGSLGNKKLGSLVDGVGKRKTSYTDYALGSKPTEPYRNWSQPVRNNKLGSMSRLARLKASAIKNSK